MARYFSMKMKRNTGSNRGSKTIPFLVALCAGLFLTVSNAKCEIRFSAGIEINSPSDFYSPLGPEGTWVDLAPYGRCWRPRVQVGWRPYTNGHWEWTDVGWYWVSDEPWSWACYHYGSWQFDPAYSWVWIPGTEWAPAWVTWRESDDYIGWAPCGPRGAVLSASLFVFVDTGHFRDHLRPNQFIVNNTTIINRTRVVNNFQRETRTIQGARQTVVVNQGPRMDLVQRSSRSPLNPVPITQVVSETPIPSNVRHAPWRENAVREPSTANRNQFRNDQERQQSAPRQQQPAVITPEQNQRERFETTRPAQPVPAPIQTPPTPTGRERGYPNREQATPREQPPAAVTPQPRERERVPTQPAPVIRQQPPVQAPPTPTGRERGYSNREQVNPPPSQVAPPREQPVRREAVPERKVVPDRQGPPPEKERGRDREKDKE